MLDERGRRLERLTGARLRAAMGWPTAPRATTRLAPFAVGIAFPDLTFRDDLAIPPLIRHRLTVRLAPGLPVPPVVRNVSAEARVTRREPVAIAPPLAGPSWIAIIEGHVPSLDAMTRATEAGTPIPVDRSEAGDHTDQGLLGLEVLTFPG